MVISRLSWSHADDGGWLGEDEHPARSSSPALVAIKIGFTGSPSHIAMP